MLMANSHQASITFLFTVLSLCGISWYNTISVDAFASSSHKRSSKLHSSSTENNVTPTDRIRAAVFQPPILSSDVSNNPLAILTQVADSLRVASSARVDVVLFPELFLSGGPTDKNKALDRGGYELNIVGNICEELNIACIIGYAENIHESELNSGEKEESVYNSIAAFNGDGSRAGNYRSISTTDGFKKGHPFVESIPILLTLPNREGKESREIKIGLMCGADILSPEHCRNLVNCGAHALFTSSSFRNTGLDRRLIDCVAPTRAMENRAPLLFANYVQSKEFIGGSSAIIGEYGDYLVRSPQEEGGDMQSDCGYLLPCEIGSLFAADIDSAKQPGDPKTTDWELKPNYDLEEIGNKKYVKAQQANGFGNGTRRTGKANKLK